MNELKIGDRVRVNPALLFGLAGEVGVVDSIIDDYILLNIDGHYHEIHKDFLIDDLNMRNVLDIEI